MINYILITMMLFLKSYGKKVLIFTERIKEIEEGYTFNIETISNSKES